MSVQETTSRVQDQVLEAIKVGQNAVISAVDTITETAGTIADKLPKLPNLPAAPFADRLPKPAEMLDSYFSFAQKVLANQKDFTLKLVEATLPVTAPQAAPKARPKAA